MKKTAQSWLSSNTISRLIAAMLVVTSVFMSAAVFLLLLQLENQLLFNDCQFSKDLSSIVARDIMFAIERNNLSQLKSFIEQIYLSTSRINYIQLYDSQGNSIVSFPNGYILQQDIVSFSYHALNLKYDHCFLNQPIPIIYESVPFQYSAIDSIIPLVKNSCNYGFLRLGLSSSFSIFTDFRIIQKASIIVFVSVWLIFMSGATFNFFAISESIRLLLAGLQAIAAGDFNYRIESYVGGQLSDLIIVFNQVSERLQFYEKKNVAQLISEKAKLEALVSTIADGAILLDTELRFLFVNQVAVKVFHWSNKDLLGRAIAGYLPAHANEALLPILNGMVKSNCFDNKMLYAQEITIDLRYESLKTFRFLLSTVLSQADKVLNGVVITIQDITREAQLNTAKNQFIGNVSHELRTPLCNIGSFLETLIDYRHKLSSEQTSQFLSIAYTETQRLNKLVNDILDLSKLEVEYTYLLSPLFLSSTITYIVQSSQIVALNKNVKIHVEIHSEVTKVLAHESSLCQVLSNLISNSLKFTHSGGQIVIRVYPLFKKSPFKNFTILSPQIARIEVIDEGVGINKMFQKQIFDRFMRIENNIHTLQGTGLGLSIVKNIIEKHNSIISLYSEVNIGASFWFDLFIAY